MDLNGGKDAIATLAFGQQWHLSSTGNWSTFREDANGDGSYAGAGAWRRRWPRRPCGR
jgi:hypothetical protein